MQARDNNSNVFLSEVICFLIESDVFFFCSIKPCLQHFHFCRFALSLRIIIFSILSPYQRCFCCVEAVKSRPEHSIINVIFLIQHIIAVSVVLFSFNFLLFRFGWFQYSFFNIVESSLGYVFYAF
jgi:hypothetical protein